ncbi:MAG: hypothetical protein DLM60_15755 [Pseudonocardiales bacterium]|nr:hypothetical protein [Actinomycetota bacterium]PZS16251.1 MAG: hypothetical protein DLM60_15755 [Pseudonocardiales bacterium]
MRAASWCCDGRELDTTDVCAEQEVRSVEFTALILLLLGTGLRRQTAAAAIQLWGGSQWVGTLRIVPSQAHGSVFTVRDFVSRAGDAEDGGGDAGRGF